MSEEQVGVSTSVAGCSPTKIYGDQESLGSLIREAAVAAGFGQTDPSAPLADVIRPGASVLLKPNWVLHENRGGATMDCMVTHPAFIQAVLREVIAARPRRVMIADAPIQGANFDCLATPAWRQEMAAIAGATPVEVLDLRNTVARFADGVLTAETGRRPAGRFVVFDLGRDSLLEEVSTRPGQFRNTSYNPRHMARVQGPGVHKFALCKEPFEADVIVSLPKLKAHAKAGITAALKNVVGLNGDKDYLPHHRIGGSTIGGDCYSGLKPFKRLAELFVDNANRRIGGRLYNPLMQVARLANALHGGDLEGKWYGNDTTWRMVLDLNRILLYGDASGFMHDVPQRQIVSITDGIIAGDRNGPLAPEPVPLGAVTCARNSAHADVAHLALMGFDRQRVPVVREAFRDMRWPLARKATNTDVYFCGRRVSLEGLAAAAGKTFRPPDGWHCCASYEPQAARPPRT